jgi:acyl-coenzyme A synthetase/AMP-(fatty) acid ligase
MPELEALQDLLFQGRQAGLPVARLQGQSKSWEDFLRGASAWRAALEPLKPKRVALHHAQTWDFACALFGLWSLGAEAVIPGDALPATCASLSQGVDLFAGDFPEGQAKPLCSQARGGSLDLGAWKRRQPAEQAISVFTSGSSGQPQAFPKSFGQLSAELACLERSFGARLGTAGILSTVSHQHIYGLLFKVLWPLSAGREFLSHTLFFPEEILAAARFYPSTVLISSPAHLKRLPSQLPWTEVQEQWKAVFSSGGPLPWEGAKLCQSLLGQAPLEVYGSSETGGIAWRERKEESGAFIPFDDVELRFEEGSQLLEVRSPKLPDAQWFKTSDMGRMNAQGRLELLGRQDRILKIEEKRISLEAVERALLASGLASEAKVLPLEQLRGSLGAVLVLTAKGKAMESKALHEALREAAAQSVERVGLPKRWRVLEAMPLNAQGKVTQKSLLKLFEGQA